MAVIDSKIFKKYDIRGTAEGSSPVLTPQIAHEIGRAFATYLERFEEKQITVVGYDNRRTSYDLAHAAMDGLCAANCQVIDIGLVSTPVVYWHAVNRGNIGALMVTGSHLPPDQNGFKLGIGSRNLYGEQIQALRAIIEANEFFYGSAEVTVDHSAYSKYVHDLEERLRMARRLHVVVDAGNGTAGLFAPYLFQLWGHRVTGIFTDPDGSYPNHHPDPENPQNMQALSAKVREVGAHVGIAFDGDADRMGAVDENGSMIAADRVLALLARDMLKRHPGAVVVADVLSSQVLFDEVKKAGGTAYMSASGHSIVKDQMKAKGALLGGEMSGHIFLGEDYFGYDDGYFAAGRLLQLLAAGSQPLSALNATLPTLYSTPEYRPHCPDEDKQKVIDGAAAALKGMGDITDVDGVRIKFERGWGLLRASNTEPVLSLRFEGETEADALKYRDLFVDALKAYPQVEKFG